jgi:hypothetical protein
MRKGEAAFSLSLLFEKEKRRKAQDCGLDGGMELVLLFFSLALSLQKPPPYSITCVYPFRLDNSSLSLAFNNRNIKGKKKHIAFSIGTKHAEKRNGSFHSLNHAYVWVLGKRATNL